MRMKLSDFVWLIFACLLCSPFYTSLAGDSNSALKPRLEPAKDIALSTTLDRWQDTIAQKLVSDINVEPFTLEIHVVPPLAGLRFSLAGRAFETGEDGVAKIEIMQTGPYLLEALPLESDTTGFRIEFARWGDYVFTTQRELEISSSISLEAGFHISYPVRLNFIDPDGNPVPPERVSMVEIKNSVGDVYTFAGDQSQWLQAGLVVSRDIRLVQVEVVNSVQRVMVDGSNVVNRGQQRFIVTPEKTPQIELILYPAQFTARDALFGFPVGHGILLEYPDGRKENFSFGDNRILRIESLARGTYHATVSGVPGIKLQNIFVLSRPQEISLIAISLLDIFVVFLLSIIIFAGLLLTGHPRLRDNLRRIISK